MQGLQVTISEFEISFYKIKTQEYLSDHLLSKINKGQMTMIKCWFHCIPVRYIPYKLKLKNRYHDKINPQPFACDKLKQL